MANTLGGRLLPRCGGGIDLSDGTGGRREIRFQTGKAYTKGVTFWLDPDGKFESPLDTKWLWAGDDLFDASTDLNIKATGLPFTSDEIDAIVDAAVIAFGAQPSVIYNRLEAAGTKIQSMDELCAYSDADINHFVQFDFKDAIETFTQPDPSGILEERRFECWMCESWCPACSFTLDLGLGGMTDQTDALEFVTVLGRRVYQPRTACTSCVHDLGTETRS